MAGKFLFGDWRFVGRLMRKKGLLLVVVLLLQAGLLVSLGVVLSMTKVKDTAYGHAAVRLEGEALHASFSPDKDRGTTALQGMTEAVLVLAVPEYPEGLCLPVEVVQFGPDNVLLRTLDGDAARLNTLLRRGGSRTTLASSTFRAQLVFRRRTLLSAIIQDRKNAKEGRGAAFLSGL